MSQYMYCYIQMKNLCSNTCKKLHKKTCNFFTGGVMTGLPYGEDSISPKPGIDRLSSQL